MTCVRVLTRLMCGARELLGTVVVFGNRTRRAKRRRLGVLNAKDKQQRRRVYRDLLKVTEETYRSAQRVAEQLEESGLTEPVKRASTERTAADFAHFLVLTKKVINQTQRRVIDEERVPAEEKVPTDAGRCARTDHVPGAQRIHRRPLKLLTAHPRHQRWFAGVG